MTGLNIVMSENGKDVNFADACEEGDLKYILELIDKGADINQTGDRGQNGLLRAAFGGNKVVIKELHSRNKQLIHGVDHLGKDNAVTLACWNADIDTVKLLDKLGADMNHANEDGWNGLLCAACLRNNDIISYLHSRNSDLIHAKTWNGHTAITLACVGSGDLETVKLLEKFGADINLTGRYKRTALAFAAQKGKLGGGVSNEFLKV